MNVVNVKMHYADDSEAGHHIIRSFLFLLRQVYAERTSIISTNDRPSGYWLCMDETPGQCRLEKELQFSDVLYQGYHVGISF
jgi:hypothetical protein